MAVVQISRIQLRRGKASSGTGIPQLASGEMAWALDTQELYIGNGSVAEGSPAVGNTKVITELDLGQNGRILDLIKYIYRKDSPLQTGPTTNTPVFRTLQQRFDDRVSTINFGVVGDGVADDTSALQRAINQLFLNPGIGKASDSVQDRISLEMPAGEYKISSTLYIPSYVTLIGAGIDSTQIYYDPVRIISGSTTLNSSTIITTAADSSMVGSLVIGNGIPSGTIVNSMISGTSLTISAPATATGVNQSLRLVSSGPAVRFINDTSSPGNPSAISSTFYNNQPRFITLKNLSISIDSVDPDADQGVWVITTPYVVGDIVSYNNHRYQATQANTGRTPPTPFGGSQYWITLNTVALQMDCVRDSHFENINILHNNYGLNSGTADNENKAIRLNAFSDVATCERNTFINIAISGFTQAVYSNKDIRDNKFTNCVLTSALQGFVLGFDSNGSTPGQKYGPTSTLIKDCQFTDIKWHAVIIGNPLTPTPAHVLGQPRFCSGNTVSNCRLSGVGNNGGTNVLAEYPQIYIEHPGNITEGILSDRVADLSSSQVTPYVPEVAGTGKYTLFGVRDIPLGQITTTQLAFRLPVNTTDTGNPVTGRYISYAIDYSYSSNLNNHSRRGTIRLVADVAATVSTNLPVFQLTDEYDFAGSEGGIPTEPTSLDLEFSMTLLTENGNTWTPGSGAPHSISINYTNPLDSGRLIYSYTAIF
jgi:hypothetical protein